MTGSYIPGSRLVSSITLGSPKVLNIGCNICFTSPSGMHTYTNMGSWQMPVVTSWLLTTSDWLQAIREPVKIIRVLSKFEKYTCYLFTYLQHQKNLFLC